MNEQERMAGIGKYFEWAKSYRGEVVEPMPQREPEPEATAAPGRRDWDYVSMSDYTADMAEATRRTRAIIERNRIEKEGLERQLKAAHEMIALLIARGGGETVVTYRERANLNNFVLTMEESPQHNGWILKARL